MKRIIIFSVLCVFLSAPLMFSPLFGHPVWGEKTILTQPNGTKIVGYIYGDEYHRRIETEEGYTIVLNEETGTIEYAVLENNKIVPSGMIVGVASTAYLGRINLPKRLTDRKYRIAEIREKSPERFHNKWPDKPEEKEVKKQPLTGTKKVFMVCVQFQPETTPPTQWSSGFYPPSGFDTRLFSTNPSDISMTNYYKSNSYNTFWPDGDTYSDWITLPQTASWYKTNGSWRQIIIDAMDEIRNIDPSYDFTQHATGGDMDMIIVWAGTYESWGDFYWPHMSLATVIRYGVRVQNYNAVNERETDGSEDTSISTFCHEYGHMTGCPDLYDYSSFQLTPIGYYCVMGRGGRNSNFCGVLKWRVYEWVTPKDIFTNGTYSIDALGLSSASNPRLYRISIDSPEEYLLLEDRHNGADPNYENVAGRRNGLLITHIDENYPPNECLPDHTFYGVEAVVPGLNPLSTNLADYAALYDEMVFGSDHGAGFTRLEPAVPDDMPPGAYLTLTSGDDTENVIYRNTQSHTSAISSGIYITDISSSGTTMSFSAIVPPMSPEISGSVENTDGDGVAGVTLSFSGGAGSTTTDTDGNYVHSVSSGWSGTVTPTKTGNIFYPANRSYSNVTSSKVDQDYSGSTSFIKGRVTNDLSSGIKDVIVAVYSASASYITSSSTDSNGDYLIGGLSTGNYWLWFWTGISSGMYAQEWYNDKDSFSAADSVSVTAGSTTSGVDAVLAKGGNIEGRVTNVLDAGIELVLVEAYASSGNLADSDFTNSNGGYSILGLKAGSYKLNFNTTYAIGNYYSEWYNDQASMGTADSISVTEWSVTSDINAQLSSPNPFISGTVATSGGAGIQGVTITFSGGAGTATTDSDGDYSQSVTFGWSGTATPSKAGYTFSPTSRNYNNVTSDQSSEDYTGTVFTYTISGNVSTAVASMGKQSAAGLSGVLMDGLPGDPTTDASGNYNATVDYAFTATVTPTLAGYSFTPPSRDYSSVTSDQQNHDYTASIIQCTLTIAAGTGGTTSPAPGSYPHNYGTQVQVTASPDSGYQFAGWSGAATGTTSPVTITMDADKTLTAAFSAISTGDGDGGGGGGCFIATAAYGSPIHPHLDTLRDFRDEYLITNGFGRKFVELYYRYSPGIAGFIAKHELLRVAVRINLLPVIAFSSLMVHFGPTTTAVVLILMLVFSILFMRFYQRKGRIF
ncbi:MAG: hypothetical protein JSV96_07500 [Candidatus Aminicenantes bacterium]|nr:MAG: hypothetical protein JSV96_07500 [Candidatus Aminicenantes bacterium]